jgi:methyltransferase-like protein 23
MDTTVPLIEKKLMICGQSFAILVPDEIFVQQKYLEEKKTGPHTDFPYWAKIWPSAIALSGYLLKNPVLYKNKIVLELAGGLGLPSLVAAAEATRVICSDYAEDAIALVKKSVTLHRYTNVEPAVIDLFSFEKDISCDLLLLSDINYDMAVFGVLKKIVLHYLQQQTTILLSTPQRLMAKPFIDELQQYIVEQEDETGHGELPITIFLLQKQVTDIVA